jgi:hypothetical protein
MKAVYGVLRLVAHAHARGTAVAANPSHRLRRTYRLRSVAAVPLCLRGRGSNVRQVMVEHMVGI